MIWEDLELWPLSIEIQLLIPLAMLTHRLPRRAPFAPRLALSVAAVAAAVTYPVATGLAQTQDAVLYYFSQFVNFSIVLAMLAFFACLLFEVGVWPALFCASTGYAAQNLTSGLSELARMLASGAVASSSDGANNAFSPVTWSIVAVVYLVFWQVFAKRLDPASVEGMRNRSLLLMFVVVALAVIGLDVLIKSICADDVALAHAVLLRLAHALVCCFVLFAEYQILFVQQLEAEKAATERMLAEQGRQYELSRANIEAINIKCHDLRHQVRSLGAGEGAPSQAALDDLAREIDVFDSAVKTGNDALDTILTEKSLVCGQHGIRLGCIADGEALAFMDPADLYAFFGNALDNAMEAAGALDDPGRRAISLMVRRRASMVSIHVENYCSGEVRFGADGLPRTSKGDAANHGFGTRSMRLICEKYAGMLSLGEAGGVFSLDAAIPAPPSA